MQTGMDALGQNWVESSLESVPYARRHCQEWARWCNQVNNTEAGRGHPS
jgi:hypothetical protein